ncbi:P-loop containing nucleoside triphosphate hydrolase protein [Aspergillus keveii]|uniref:P-loop containing nucleoside triphosphate hydrolase protein n=1 Tax=Aspergillus keveii TaxID=714993 RepID=A0ABR4FUT0_9EURO
MAAPLPFPTTPYPRLDRDHDYDHFPGRQSEMKVLALGMPRTGTMSLYTALNELGYNCYHMAEAALDHRNGSLKHWQAAIVAKYYDLKEDYRGEDFDRMLWRYDAVTDIPSILFAEGLMNAYPDAQIILTTRNVDGWLSSMERAFYKVLNMKRWRLLELFDYTYTRPYMHLLRTTLNIWTDSHWRDKDQLTAKYIAHNAQVRGQAQIRGRRVLEFDVRDGWRPLCEFLGKPIPPKPFPWVNRGDFIAQYHYIGFWIRVFYVLRPVGGAGWVF